MALFIIMVMILLTALYVAAEFAIISVKESRIEELADDGHATAKQLLPILNDGQLFDNYIAASQIGITLTGLILGALGQSALGPFLRPALQWLGMPASAAEYAATVLILVVMTAATMIFGELMPKSLALQNPTQLALLTARPMRWFLWLFHIPILIFNGSGNLILRLMGVEPESHKHVHSPEEIDYMITESLAKGLFEPEESKRLQKALKLGSLTVRDLMVPRMYMTALDLDQPAENFFRQVLRSPYSILPVYHQSPDNIRGMIKTKHLIRHYAQHNRMQAPEKFVRPMLAIPRNIPITVALDKLKQHHTHQAIVVDEYGGVAGLITLQDILSEFMGAIGDEFKQPRSKMERTTDGRLRLSGQMRLDHLESELGIPWESEQASTVAGYVVEALDRFPQQGEQCILNGITVEIEGVSSRSVLSVIITLPTPAKEEDHALD
jgi:putative hemolysin